MHDFKCAVMVAFFKVSLAFSALSPMLTKICARSSLAIFAADEIHNPTNETGVLLV